MSSAPLLSIRGVYKAYDQNIVLRDINIDVDAHEVICLIGASGCGKSTLLRCINLLDEINAGSITLSGEQITGTRVNRDRIRQRIGMVFQSFNLFPHLNVLANITLAPTRALGVSKKEAHDQAIALLDRFGLASKASEFPDRLSGGEQQRVAVIRALALKPEVMLLDEVTSALDPEMVGEVLAIIAELKTLGMTMLFATHQLGFARQIADRVLYLHDGRILEQGSPDQIFSNPQNERTRQFVRQISAASPSGGE